VDACGVPLRAKARSLGGAGSSLVRKQYLPAASPWTDTEVRSRATDLPPHRSLTSPGIQLGVGTDTTDGPIPKAQAPVTVDGRHAHFDDMIAARGPCHHDA